MTGALPAVGIQLFPGDPAAAVDEADAAEQLGFDSVWIADHFHGAGRGADWVVPECMAVLGAIAARTATVQLGTCVASTTKRDPALLAHSALTLNKLAGGRFSLGLGTGFGPDLNAFGVRVEKPAARLEQTLDILEGLWASSSERPFDYTWAGGALEGAYLNVPGTAPPPVLLASIGPRLMRLTARRADGWLPFGLTPDLYGQFLDALGTVRPGFQAKLWIPTFVEAPGEDRSAEAEATGRLYLSMAPAVLELALDGADGGPVAPSTLDWTPARAQEIAEAIPRELALAAVLHGSPEACVNTLRSLASSGCEEVVLRITEPERRMQDAALIAKERSQQ